MLLNTHLGFKSQFAMPSPIFASFLSPYALGLMLLYWTETRDTWGKKGSWLLNSQHKWSLWGSWESYVCWLSWTFCNFTCIMNELGNLSELSLKRKPWGRKTEDWLEPQVLWGQACQCWHFHMARGPGIAGGTDTGLIDSLIKELGRL